MLNPRKVPHLRFRSQRNGQSGMAVIEMIPILIIIVLLLNFTLGFFGVIHTGILNSIAARNYAFETFRHNSNLNYFFRKEFSLGDMSNFSKYNHRIHGIASEYRPKNDERWLATSRTIAFVEPFGGVNNDGRVLAGQGKIQNSETDLHNNKIFTIKDDGSRTMLDAAPVWIRPVYGICIKASCQP